MNISSATAYKWMAQDATDNKATLVQVMTAPSHTWASVDSDPCRHMASPTQNK